ncbi:ATP-binding protein [Streptomyces sp. B1866]|uniref:ATP-binding protein n=1 Tax=Streptomyces sp. B1866 TaxID=3075431 RepID=UPI00288D88BA|nr:ATP-binding protein [Streptomyces sp. B1866]MDT3395302.1 ATP-binding protein [Streptomyces sp. B1866]
MKPHGTFARDSRPGEPPSRLHLSFVREPEQVHRLRAIGAAQLRHWHLGRYVDTATLLISELATNAIQYGDSDDVELCISYLEDTAEVRVEVDDKTSGDPKVRHPGTDEENGRGLIIVEALADRWGRNGTSTWCCFAVVLDGAAG